MRPYPFKRKPYAHQVKALKTALRLKTCALLMEPRTGKTKTAVDYLSALAMVGKIDRAVIIAPAQVLAVWVEAFHEDCPVRFHLCVWDAKARKHPPPKVSAHYDLSVVLVNYEAFSTPGKKLASGNESRRSGRFKNREHIERWLDGYPAACVLDESHKIKSPSSKAATMIVSMRDYFDYRLILTGTPITKAKRVFDIHMQWKFLNPRRFGDVPTHDEFKQRYGQWHTEQDSRTGNSWLTLTKLQNVEELTERIYADSVRVKRSECFDLPPRSTVIRKVALGQKSGAAYDELAKEMVAQIEHEDKSKTVEAQYALVLTLRLSQITGGYVKVAEERDEVGNVIVPEEVIQVGTEKLKALEELIDETVENDEKMVVAARFRPEMDAIVAMIRRKGIPALQVRGGIGRAEVAANIRQFKEHDGAAVLCMNPQAGGVGIDLSSAAHMVWFSLTSSWVDYTQACDRIALSSKATTYTYLLAEGTVDELLYEVLQTDGDVAEKILTNPRKVLRA